MIKIRLKNHIPFPGVTYPKDSILSAIVLSSDPEGVKFQFKNWVKYLWFDEFEFI